MVISKTALAKIREIISKHYSTLTLSLAGSSVFTDQELLQLQAEGIDINKPESLLEMIYYNYVLNDLRSREAPATIEGMREQQRFRPVGNAHESAEEHVNQNFKHVVEKMKTSVQSRIEGIIRDNNNTYRNNALQNLTRPEDLDQLMKESTVGKLKQKLREYSTDAYRDWDRVAVTETANALGMGSVDRIVMQNQEKPASEIYVYRISVQDAALCKFCKQFYVDTDGSPKVYKLSTILNNGTNYGKPTVEWKPVAVATHPNERCSGILELKPGWKVLPGGSVDFIGLDAWEKYIKAKLQA